MRSMWTYPEDRYYYAWYDGDPEDVQPSDGDLKSIIVNRLRDNRYTKDEEFRVDVMRGVVILTGDVTSARAKRAAGDDSWDTPGVTDVSNQLDVTATRSTGDG